MNLWPLPIPVRAKILEPTKSVPSPPIGTRQEDRNRTHFRLRRKNHLAGGVSWLCRLTRVMVAALTVAALTVSARGQSSVTLAWNPDAGTNIAGYKIYYGVASRTYTNTNNVGNVTNATITSLIGGTIYYFAATAVDTSGLESDYSTEVVYTNPPATAPTLMISRGSGGAAAQIRSALPAQTAVTLVASGPPSQTYNVLSSQDLVTWTIIGTITLDATGSGQFTDPASTSLPKNFYRLQSISLTLPKLQIRASAGGPVVLSGTGPAGHSYNVQCTQDLEVWTVIGSVTLDLNGSFSFTDPAGTSRPRCFYRLQGQ